MKPIYFVSVDDVETQVLEWGTFQWMNEPRVTGAQKQILGLGKIEPGFGHTRHNHPDSEEFIYFLSGNCHQTLEVETEGGKLYEKDMTGGEMIYIPQGWYHSTVNTGTGTLTFLCCYLNAGTELAIYEQAIKILPPKNPRD